ncbi:MAG: choice-of-anchor tandem repeat GloVer-containing protein [Terriglobales bacterium]
MNPRLFLFALLALAVPSFLAAQTFTLVHSFQGPPDGGIPIGTLIGDNAGNIYGTTEGGGGSQCLSGFIYGCGTIFKVDPSGQETILHSFTDQPDGANPVAGLTIGPRATAVGTTSAGGANGFGSIYSINAAGLVILYSFTGGPDGASPVAPLLRDAANNLYGTSLQRGGFSCGEGCGTVFKLSSKDQESVLYGFSGVGGDGASPYAGLIRDSSGNLYGTTVAGGDGFGTVFEVNPQGIETVLYSFKGGRDGGSPWAGLLLDASHRVLYGTTSLGGDFNQGTVFKITGLGKETVIYSFRGSPDGANPGYGTLLPDAAGNLYGTTAAGGNQNGNCFDSSCGTVFKLSHHPNGTWTETVLYSFTGGNDGDSPQGGLFRDPSGALWGTASSGGAFGAGTIFKIAP